MKLNNLVIAASSALVIGTVACGEDSNGNGDDNGGNGTCVGHTCPNPIRDTLDDRGEVRFEFLELPGGVQVNRGTAYRVDQDRTTPIGYPSFDGCFSVRGDDRRQPYDLYPWNQRDGRTYEDFGETVTVEEIGGSNLSFTLNKTSSTQGPEDMRQNDFLGRQHDTWYRFFDNMNAQTEVIWNKEFVATIDGEQYTTFVPNRLTSNLTVGETRTFQAGQDFTLEFTVEEQAIDADLFLIAVWSEAGAGNTHMCIWDDVGEDQPVGTQLTKTIPASIIDGVAASGSYIVGKITHEVFEHEGGRMDILGMNCLLTPYEVQ